MRALRNARAEYGVEPQRKIGAVVVAQDATLRAVSGCLVITVGKSWR